MSELHLHDVEVSSSPSFFQTIEGRYVLCNDTLIVFQMDNRVIDLLKGSLKGKVNGINIIHIPIESGVTQYEKDVADLIKYIIFEQQNDIVNGNLFFINERSEYHQKAVAAVNANARKITKNAYEIFPKVADSCFNKSICSYHFSVGISDDYHRSWFGEEAVYTTEREEIPMPMGIDCTQPPYSEDETYYELIPPAEEGEGGGDGGESATPPEPPDPSIPGVRTPDPTTQYRRVWIHEYYTIKLTRFYGQFMGLFNSAVADSSGQIKIKHTVRPDEYKVVGP